MLICLEFNNNSRAVAVNPPQKGKEMEKIVLKKVKEERKPKRTSVVIKPETYVKIYELAHEVNITVESLVDLLLNEALNSVEVIE